MRTGMRTGWIGVIVLAVGFLAAEPGVQAQAAPQSGTPDFSGIWVGLGGLPQTADTAICSIAPLCGALAAWPMVVLRAASSRPHLWASVLAPVDFPKQIAVLQER